MTLGEKIIELRKKRGLSQEDLAITLGVSRQAVSKWETAESTPDTDKIVALAEYFDVTTDWLLRDIVPETASAGSGEHAALRQAEEGAPVLLCLTLGGCASGLLSIGYGCFYSQTMLPILIGGILLIGAVAMAMGFGLLLKSKSAGAGRAFLCSFWRIAVWLIAPVALYPVVCVLGALLTEIPQRFIVRLWLVLPKPVWRLGRVLLFAGVPLALYLAVCLFVSLRLCRRPCGEPKKVS